MRIVAGRFRGRQLAGPGRLQVRPTSDRLRETLFNVIAARVDGARVLDAFAGTGAVGLEALSRGARHVTFIEADRGVARVLDGNIAALGVAADCDVIRGDALRVTPGHARQATSDGAGFDVQFYDPPYDVASLDAVLARASDWIAPGGLVVLEHAKRRSSPEIVGTLRRTRLLEAGDSALSFYGVAAP